MLSGRNDSDGEESTNSHTVKIPGTTKKYIIYWNLFANQDPQRFRKMNRELPEGVYFESGRSKKKTGVATAGKKKKTKKDIHQEMVLTEMRRGINVDQDRLKAELSRSRFIQHAFQVDSLTKLNQQKGDLSDRKEKKKLEIIADMDGDSNKKRRKEYQRRRKDHAERKKARGGKKDPLTQESYASDFDYIDDLEAQEAHTAEEIEEVRAIMKKSKEEGDENGKIAGNSEDDAIAID
jgi:hypothetical protein